MLPAQRYTFPHIRTSKRRISYLSIAYGNETI
jgi:hypothetical protein